jgi:hypothetical protein
LELQVFDLSSGVRSQLCKIEKSKSLKTNLIFKHLNDSISQSATAFDFYKSPGENYMTINSNSSGVIFISLGNYNVNSRPIGVLNLGVPLIPSVVTFVTTTLYLRSQPFFKTDGLFMYLTGNRLNGYSILNDQSSPKGTLNERILNFEKSFPNLQFKDYFDFETQLTAIYKYSADSDFTFVRFDK